MSQDVLAPYRKPGTQPAAPPERSGEQGAGQGGYEAYAVATGTAKLQRLEIRPGGNIISARSYSTITEILFDCTKQDRIWLLFPGLKFIIQGRGLRPVYQALKSGVCEFIAALPEGTSAPEGVPVISKILLEKKTKEA